jgi:hypothetical protein
MKDIDMGRHSNRALLSISAALVASCVVGCSGDDTSSSLDGGGADGSQAVDAAVDGAATDAGKADSTAADGSVVDGSSVDGAGSGVDGSSVDGAGSIVDGSSVDGSISDAGTTDAPTDSAASHDGATGDGATTDASDAAAPQPLALCAAFDSRFLLNEADAGVAAAESARTQAWAFSIYDNFFNETGAYIGGDCSFSGFTLAVTNSSDMGGPYITFLDSWIQQFLGCPTTEDAGALAYGLLPPELAGHLYTTADLNKLSSDFVDAINNTLTCAGDCLNGPSPSPDGGTLADVAPLTDEQVASIRAELAYLQSHLQVSPTPLQSPTISFSTDPQCNPSTSCLDLCPTPDAGAQDASGD